MYLVDISCDDFFSIIVLYEKQMFAGKYFAGYNLQKYNSVNTRE
jgi:hypothetical protein